MADNVLLNAGAGGATLASDDIGGVQYQRVKLEIGADGAAADVHTGNPLPVSDAGGSLTVDGTVAVSGSVAVTGPVTDAQLRATAVPVSGTVTTTPPANASTNVALAWLLNLGFAATSDVVAAPVLTSLTPATIQARSAALFVVLTGTGFTDVSGVLINGSAHVVLYSSATVITTRIPASELLTAGTLAVVVVDPVTGTSNTRSFTITALTLTEEEERLLQDSNPLPCPDPHQPFGIHYVPLHVCQNGKQHYHD